MLRIYLIKLQRNIFALMLAASLLLGFALAYLGSAVVTLTTSVVRPGAVAAASRSPAGSRSREAAIPSKEEFQQIAVGNLVRGKDAAIPEENIEGPSVALENIKVVGLLAGSPRYARASIRTEGEAESYAIGEQIGALKLVAIYVDAVRLEDEQGNSHRVALFEGKSKDKKSKGSARSGSEEKKITLSRDRFNQYIKDQKELFRAKFAPFIKKGKIIGWRLLKVPSDHFLYSMGARSGDVVRRFNGQPLENQERLISMWQSLQTLDQMSIDVERGSRVITYNVNIQ